MRAHFKGRSLSHKLLIAMMTTTLVTLVVALSAMVAYDLRAYHQGWIADLNAQAELLSRTTAPALSFNDVGTARENLNFLRFTKVRAAVIYAPSGKVFASYFGEGIKADMPPMPTEEGLHIMGRQVNVFKRIVENGDVMGMLYLQADYALYDRVISYLGIAGTVIAASMLVAYLLSNWLQRILTQPVLAIASTAREVVEQGNYSRRADKSSDDEVGVLADSFNNMLSEIERRTRELEISNKEKDKEVEERRLAQFEVMQLNSVLEQRVQERTMQLEASNGQLALAKQVAESANRAKSEFLSNMSHELRTPLNAIIGFGQLLTSENLPYSAQQQHEFTRHILKAGHHLLELINEILNLAQIESGKLSLSLETVDLDEVLDDCKTMIQPQCDQRGIRLLFPAHHGLRVDADRLRLRQVLLNLLSNAVKYNRDAGSVVLECSVVHSDSGDTHVRIAVQDTGMGLSAEQIRSLFQPFNRLGQEAGTIEGTGIGLVVTRHLVEMMGGQIGVSSTVGMGTLFWIDLRSAAAPGIALVSPPAAPALPLVSVAPDDTRALVLYVEDNPASLRLVEEILGYRNDLRLVSARDALQGIKLAQAYQPRLILMDNNLPGMDGLQALSMLRADARTSHIPVIALTANAMPQAIAEGLEKGFFRYVTKPIRIEDLTQAIDQALKQNPAQAA
jgi:signal transduction histidine kinase/ActR/RegA family two-component response regulator